MTQETSGVIAADPADELPAGSELQFMSVSIWKEFQARAVYLENWSAFEGMVLAANFADTSAHIVEGSAVLVAPGVALTARHYFEMKDHSGRLSDLIPIMGLLSGRSGALFTGITSHGLQMWRLHKYTPVPGTDIAILGLALASAVPPDRRFYQAKVTTRLPRIGEKVMVVGFRPSQDSFGYGGSVNARLIMSSGVVTDRYPERVDSYLTPWPAIAVDCPSWGGMSGGPVFHESGALVGLVAASLSTHDPADPSPSLVSLLWPALAYTFEGGWPAPAFTNRRTLAEMAPRVCAIDRPEAISSSVDPDTGVVTVNYAAWE